MARASVFKIVPKESSSFPLVISSSIVDASIAKSLEYSLNKGESRKGLQLDVTINADGFELEDVILSTLSSTHFAFSQKALDILIRLTTNSIETIPFTITKESQSLPYYFINVLTVLEALDTENTKWVRPEERDSSNHPILNIAIPALRSSVVAYIPLFLLKVKSDISSGLYISSNLKTAFEEANITGIEFKEIKTL